MTRIIAGRKGGQRLQVPAGRGTRPTTDRVREAVFSRLEHLGAVRDAHVLDLYAGSGALGLEAASRGAASVLLVEGDRKATAILERNAAAVDVAPITVRHASVQQALDAPPPARMHLALLDPPYDVTDEQLARVLDRLVRGGWLCEDAVLMVERSSRSPEPVWPTDCHLIGPRRYGDTTCWFAEYVPEGDLA